MQLDHPVCVAQLFLTLLLLLAAEVGEDVRGGEERRVAGRRGRRGRRRSGGICIKIGIPGKSILGDNFQ